MVKNTLLMYLRMLVLVVVQLYTVPVVLRALGVVDYGIYNVVGGFVTMFTFINGSLVSGCQRFLAYAIGQNDEKSLKQVFETSVFVFVMLAFALFILLEGIGVWFLNTQMNIPAERMAAANWVLQFSILSLIVTVCSTPFNSAVIAHDFESLYKLLIAFAITIVFADKMIVYAILLFTSSLMIGFVYLFYSIKHFNETRWLKLRWNATFLKDIVSYAGWNVIGSLAVIFRNHGLNILMNMFFTPIMNAAHTIASQISGLFTQFVNNVYIATRPQITKQYAAGNVNEMWNITFRSSRYAFYLMCYIAIPCIIELPTFLKLWLHEVPDYTVQFSRLMILSLMFETMTNQIVGAFQAANKIKFYQSVSSVILLSVVPIAYVALRLETTPILPYIIYVVVTATYGLSLIFVARKNLNLNVVAFSKEVIAKDLLVFFPSFAITFLIASTITPSYIRVLMTALASISITSCIIWLWGMDVLEKQTIRKMRNRMLRKVVNK